MLLADRASTRQALNQRRRSNTLLQSAILSPLQRGPNDLSVDQLTAPLPPSVVERTIQALEQGNTHYVDVPGVAALRDALREFVKHVSTPPASFEEIMVTAGVQEARFLALQILGDGYGSLALPDVCDPGAYLAIGARPLELRRLPVDEAGDRLPTLDGIRAVLEDGCRLLYLESPSRLSGAVFAAATLEAIAELLVQHDGSVIVDQGLAPWVASGEYVSIAALPGMAQRSVLLGEALPGIGLEGMYVAYLAAPSDWLPKLTAQKQIMAICTSTPSQFAAIAAAELYASLHAEQLRSLQAQHKQARELAEQAGLAPLPGAAANLLAVAPEGAAFIAELERRGYRFADGAAFGAPGTLRMLVTLENTLAAALAGDAPEEAS